MNLHLKWPHLFKQSLKLLPCSSYLNSELLRSSRVTEKNDISLVPGGPTHQATLTHFSKRGRAELITGHLREMTR